MNPSCADCKFYRAQTKEQGICARKPPVAILTMLPQANQVSRSLAQPALAPQVMTIWPNVGGTMWCGEHEVQA